MKQKNPNFSKTFPLWKACGLNDEIRVPLHYISFAHGYAYATNSYILVKARLTDISDFDEMDLSLLDGKFIHANNFKRIVQSKGQINIKGDSIEVVEENYTVNYPLVKGIRFPDCEKVMVGDDGFTPRKHFGMRTEHLHTLGEVLGCRECMSGVSMEWITDYKFSVKVLGTSKDISGLIMTISVY